MRRYRLIIYITLILAWATAVSIGAARLWNYSGTPGAAAVAPAVWPAETHLVHASNLPTLVLLVHPHCPCSQATLDDFARLMTACDGKVSATVLFLHPKGMSDTWVKSSLWFGASAIPGVTVLQDKDGRESKRFGAATSGQALLYGIDGRLLFAGGITESRGHSGDNAGRSAIVSLVCGGSTSNKEPVHTPVYGCPLFNDGSACTEKGSDSCCR